MKNTRFEHFSGQWSFERYISKPELHIKGNARFSRLSQSSLAYRESGTYIINEIAYDFFQKRIFMYDENSLSVYKNDGSLLHIFTFTKVTSSSCGSAKHTHQCNLDTYHCLFLFKTEQCFEINYKISGPNKDYEIRTLYTKD